MDKRSMESLDMFAENDWLGDAKDIVNRLSSVSNPYRGNKRKMLVDLVGICREEGLHEVIDGGKVLDLFAGSSFVGYMFKKMGAAVWSNDLLAFSYLSAVALVENTGHTTTPDQISDIIHSKSDHAGTFVRDNYVGDRFTEEEAEYLDNWLLNLEASSRISPMQASVNFFSDASIARENFGKDSSIIQDDKIKHLFALHAVMVMHFIIKNCDLGGRLNNGQVIARVDHRIDVKGKKFNLKEIRPYNLSFDNGLSSVATRMDALALLRDYDMSDMNVVYIDPPYGGDQSDYAKMYEFFENYLGFANVHEQEAKRFTKHKNYSQHFDELLSLLPQRAAWIFSYNDSSWSSIDEILEHISRFKNSKIKIHEIDYDYQYRAKENASGKEYVIVAN